MLYVIWIIIIIASFVYGGWWGGIAAIVIPFLLWAWGENDASKPQKRRYYWQSREEWEEIKKRQDK